MTGRKERGRPDGGRFAPRQRLEPDEVSRELGAGSGDRDEQKRRVRLTQTVAELASCLDDGEALVALGKARFDEDWLVRRAAKNIVTEFAETVSRLPTEFKDQRPEIAWRAIKGMRNRVVHVYERADPEIVWAALAIQFPRIRHELDL